MNRQELKEYKLPFESFIGGWYIPENICDDVISFFKKSRDKVPHVTDQKLSKGGDVIIEDGLILAKGTVGHNRIDLTTKDSIDMSILPRGDVWKNNEEIFKWHEYLQMCLENYVDRYKYVNELTHFNIYEPVNIQHYKAKGGFPKWHMELSSPVNMPRKLVFMTYLNDVENGGTEFYYQNIKTEAKKGLTIIWPADWTHTHRGVVSEKQEKWIITGWYGLEVIPGSRFPWL